MLIYLGRMPTQFHFTTCVLVLLACVVLPPNPAIAQDTMPLTLQEAESLALSDEPGQNSYLSHAEALREESVAGGQLPDPTMRIGLANFPIQSGGFSTEGMTQAQLAVRQVFPGGDTRQLTSDKYQSLALEMMHMADGRGREVLTNVRTSWLETYYWREAHVITVYSRPFFDDLVTITRSLYAVGRKNRGLLETLDKRR